MRIEYERPSLYEKQFNAFFNEKRYSCVEATTKAGKTHGALAWLVEKVMFAQAGQNFWWIAPVFPQAEIAFRRVKRGLPREVIKPNNGGLFIDFINGARIQFKSGEKPDNLYGEDVYAAVIDEASRVREESFHAVRSTLTATNGQLRMIGNVKGRHNWFYKMARKAEGGDPNIYYGKITALDAIAAGVITQEEVEDARRVLPEQVFQELYMAEPSDDGGNPFGYDNIQTCIKPMSSLPAKAWGIDLAKSTDWTVIIGLDANNDVCQFHRFQKPWLDTINFIRQTVKTQAFVDSTGVGDPVLEALQKNKTNFEGYRFSSNSKQQLMEGLAVSIQQQTIGFPKGNISMELEQFEYEFTRAGVKYSAPQGLHDDCVCALALADSRRKQVFSGLRIQQSAINKAMGRLQ